LTASLSSKPSWSEPIAIRMTYGGPDSTAEVELEVEHVAVVTPI
jgi:hypothetical protein